MSIQEGRVAKFDLDETGMPKTPTSYSRIDPVGASKDDYTFINPLVVDPNDANILYLPAGKSLWRQNQLKTLPLNGKWDSISTGWFKMADTITAPKTSGGFNAQITCIAVSSKPANTVYIGTSVTDVYRVDNANGANPKFTKINKFGMQGYVSSIAVDPEDDKKVLLCYSNYAANTIWYTENGGTDWKIACGNLRIAANNYSGSTPSMRAVQIVKTDTNGGRKYFLGCSVGLYSTTKLYANVSAGLDSTKWLQESPSGIGTCVVNNITHRAHDGLVAVSTHGNGAYVNKNKPTIVPDPAPPINPIDMVSNLYPNPTQSNTTYLYLDVTMQHTIHLAVYDMTGKQCIVYKDMIAQAGKNKIEIPTQGLATGIYNLVVTNENGKTNKHRFSVKH
jgi:hypothetical protein